MNKDNCLKKELPEELKGKRIDSAIAKLFPDFSRSKLKLWLEAGYILVNENPVLKSSSKFVGGETIKVFVQEEEQVDIIAQDIAIQIIEENNDFLVINKAAGMVVHPGAGNHSNTLMNALIYRYPELKNIPRAGIVHRLDKDTSGLMVVARNVNSAKKLAEQISDRSVKRIYQAFVVGEISRSGKIEEPLGRHKRNRQKQAVIEDGRYALTNYTIIKKYGNYTHVQASLATGRTHQIRVHFSHIGFPLIGDALYGRKRRFAKSTNSELRAVIELFSRQALHASNLTFLHPKEDTEVSFFAEMPEDMQNLAINLDNLA